ncbi:hypothetical protein [Marinobacter sp. ELB17]|uniref:hypothetical protein n=1 Tax=Marinobacter sp. ELB17 TaxID=270374 RepID=UPI0000F39C5D|nr:hypothetical protein [Marinobacter sp. ELB17]EAZ97238.1 hypothetical protein MELB17_10113 [Marinobacter sp. ELB17]
MPPREWSLNRQPNTSAWPGQYKSYHVQCAWEALADLGQPPGQPFPTGWLIRRVDDRITVQHPEFGGYCAHPTREDESVIAPVILYHLVNGLLSGTGHPDGINATRWSDRSGELFIDTVEKNKEDQLVYAVRNRSGLCLNHQSEWEYEPSPSGRDSVFLSRCRFHTWNEATEALHQELINIKVVGERDRQSLAERLFTEE